MTWAAFATGVAVFITAALYDATFAAYVRAAATGRAMRAAFLSVGTYLVGAVGLLALVKLSLWYAAPEALGLWTGTMAGVLAGRDVD